MKKKKPEVYVTPPIPRPIPREALRWTEKIEPDIDIPVDLSKGLSKGFLPNAYSLLVARACSSSIGHGFGQDDKTTTQYPRRLFSTKLLALRSMRNEVEEQAAEKLNKIDEWIAQELAARTDSTTEK